VPFTSEARARIEFGYDGELYIITHVLNRIRVSATGATPDRGVTSKGPYQVTEVEGGFELNIFDTTPVSITIKGRSIDITYSDVHLTGTIEEVLHKPRDGWPRN
jgi:hypothetical protein